MAGAGSRAPTSGDGRSMSKKTSRFRRGDVILVVLTQLLWNLSNKEENDLAVRTKAILPQVKDMRYFQVNPNIYIYIYTFKLIYTTTTVFTI